MARSSSLWVACWSSQRPTKRPMLCPARSKPQLGRLWSKMLTAGSNWEWDWIFGPWQSADCSSQKLAGENSCDRIPGRRGFDTRLTICLVCLWRNHGLIWISLLGKCGNWTSSWFYLRPFPNGERGFHANQLAAANDGWSSDNPFSKNPGNLWQRDYHGASPVQKETPTEPRETASLAEPHLPLRAAFPSHQDQIAPSRVWEVAPRVFIKLPEGWGHEVHLGVSTIFVCPFYVAFIPCSCPRTSPAKGTIYLSERGEATTWCHWCPVDFFKSGLQRDQVLLQKIKDVPKKIATKLHQKQVRQMAEQAKAGEAREIKWWPNHIDSASLRSYPYMYFYVYIHVCISFIYHLNQTKTYIASTTECLWT